MKKLLLLIVAVFSLTVGLGSQASAATRYWSVTMFTPAASDTDRTLNIAYNVLSTVATDKYNVNLFQNDVQIDSQFVDHGKGGNSGAFSVTMPANGTYSYKISAENISAGETKTTDTKTVKIVDGPSPTVTTVTVNTAGQNGTGTTGATTAAANTGTGAGQVNGATTNTGTGTTNGTVNADGSSNTTAKKNGDVLGSETAKAKASDKGKWYGLGAGAIVLGGAAYYWFVMRRKLED